MQLCERKTKISRNNNHKGTGSAIYHRVAKLIKLRAKSSGKGRAFLRFPAIARRRTRRSELRSSEPKVGPPFHLDWFLIVNYEL